MKYKNWKFTKVYIIVLLLFFCACANKEIPATVLYKARLEIKGPCMNYVIKVLDSNRINKDLIEASWTQPSTSKVYTQVFTLASICTFNNALNEGDIFYFSIPANPLISYCPQCLIYVPVPLKKIYIQL